MESSQLSPEQIAEATERSVKAGADFVKTATGFTGTGAKEEELRVMLDTAEGRCKVKASGGIRDLATAKHFVEMGVARIGIGSTSMKKVVDEDK